MFKKKPKEIPELKPNEKVTRTVVTERVEKTGGVQTTRTTITCSEANFDSAFKRLNLDPEKFHSGGTQVTKRIVYTNSSGAKEVLEETVEDYGDPDKLKSAQTKKEEDKSFLKKLGLSSSKSSTTPTKASTAAGNSTKNENKAHTVVVKPGKFEDECLRAHNEYRAKHGVPSLTLSKEICSYAKEWADHLAATDRFEHRKERRYGENIFMKWSSDPNHVVAGNEAVDSWYSEIKDHTFGAEPRSLKSGHFTQVIWKESKHMGVAWARSKTGKILVVANYDPAGNFIGKFSENVPPPKK
ncbi:hypothetical protein X975_11890, partial [Stegodyphus mimosarum]